MLSELSLIHNNLRILSCEGVDLWEPPDDDRSGNFAQSMRTPSGMLGLSASQGRGLPMALLIG